MPQCQLSVFCCFWFQKSYTGNILGIARDENPIHILPSRTRTPKERRRGAVEPPQHLAAQVHPPVCQLVVWGPQGSLGVRPSPIYTSSTENPKYPIKNPRKVPSPPSSSTLDREGSGAHHQRALHHHACLRCDA